MLMPILLETPKTLSLPSSCNPQLDPVQHPNKAFWFITLCMDEQIDI